MADDAQVALAIPLARWADRRLRALAQLTGSARIAGLDGPTIIGERGSNGRFVINGRISAGIGGSRIMATRDGGWFALTILRAEDRAFLPALFCDDTLDIHDDAAIARAVAGFDCDELLARGRLIGLPVASADETPASPPVEVMTRGARREREPGHRPLVVDMSAIWAGPLAGHLLWLAGAEVVKVESPTRPDLIRRDDPATFDLINQGKANILVDLARDDERAALIDLIRCADFVIESSRPRALLGLGVDAEALVRETPGLVWLSVTGHGATGEAANWVGIGNDCGVAAGLSRAMADAGGEIGYVGDAAPDPLTGIIAAIEGWQAYLAGEARRIGFAMSAITALALREEREHGAAAIEAELRAWSKASGQVFPQIPRRELSAEVRLPGADNARYLPEPGVLIRNAEIWAEFRESGLADVRLAEGLVAAIGSLEARPGEPVIDAAGGALLPGLHDHHLHLAGLAARASSIWCGPPEVTSADGLAERLASPGSGWIRGIGYHESVMGLPGADALDRLAPERPLRMQHRSGRMWLLNSPALAELLARSDPPPGLERNAGGFTGRLFDEDQWLRDALQSRPPDFTAVSHELAGCGVTGITDMSPANDPVMASHFAGQMKDGALLQHCRLAGSLSLADAEPGAWQLGPAKLHLHEAALPDFEDAVSLVAAAHRQTRAVAIHCVSEVELVFALAALDQAGVIHGDRIEHASIAPPELVERIAAMGLAVCVQPHFVAERGDRYLVDVEARHIPDLYRLRSLAAAGIALAGGSDEPFGSADPWAAMRAALSRTTAEGRSIGAGEALTPEAALALYLAAPDDLARRREVAAGAPGDLCLLDRPWAEARERLDASDVRATFVSGRLVHDSIDQPPGQRLPGA